MSWSLLVGGQTVAERASVYGLYRTDAGAQFASNVVGGRSLTGIAVTAGEVVEFRAATQTYYGHFLGIEENITLTLIPEPGTALLFMAGGLVLGLRRKLRQVYFLA